jgi:hypothetical protein
MDEHVKQYLASLNKDQLKIIEIAKKELGTSYNTQKSIGFLNYIKKMQTEQLKVDPLKLDPLNSTKDNR